MLFKGQLMKCNNGRSDKTTQPCDKGINVYARVDFVLDWIEMVTDEENETCQGQFVLGLQVGKLLLENSLYIFIIAKHTKHSISVDECKCEKEKEKGKSGGGLMFEPAAANLMPTFVLAAAFLKWVK